MAHILELLDSCTDALRRPLGEAQRAAIIAYLADPRPATWQDVHGIVLNYRCFTVWQAWRLVDDDCPTIGRVWERQPDGSLVMIKEWEKLPTPYQIALALAWCASVAERERGKAK